MKYSIKVSSLFKKDYKVAKKRGCNMSLLDEAIALLAEGDALPKRYKDHALKGKYDGYRECHIAPDWLLVYKIVESELLLALTRTGTHSDVF